MYFRHFKVNWVNTLPDFMFVYVHLNFNVPPIRITDLVRNVSEKRFIDME